MKNDKKKLKILFLSETQEDQIKISKSLKKPAFEIKICNITNEKDIIFALEKFGSLYSLCLIDLSLENKSCLRLTSACSKIKNIIPLLFIVCPKCIDTVRKNIQRVLGEYILKDKADEYLKILPLVIENSIFKSLSQISAIEINKKTVYLENSVEKLSGELIENFKTNYHLTNKKDTLVKYNKALSHIGRLKIFSKSNFNVTLKKILKITAETLDIERTSVWMYDSEKKGIECVLLYEKSKNQYSKGMYLKKTDFPLYFKALEKERFISAHNARSDKRTKEFSNPYFIENNIYSMLDSPVVIKSEIGGVLCHEHTVDVRTWNEDEENFAASVSDKISILFEEYERIKSEEALKDSEEKWKLLVKNSPDIIITINDNLKITFINKNLTKLPNENFIGENILLFVPKMFHKRTVKTIKNIFHTGKEAAFETPAHTLTGRPFFVSVRMSLIKSKKEKVVLLIITNITELKNTQKMNQKNQKLLENINQIQAEFILQKNKHQFFQNLLEKILRATESEFGFLGELFYDSEKKPYIKAYAVSDIAWNKASRNFYEKYKDSGVEFRKLNNLYGHVLNTGKMVISNDPQNDSRSKGLPKGHPPIKSFVGIPLYRGKEFIGMAGFANRKKGYTKEFIAHLNPFISVCETIIEAHRNNRLKFEAEEELKHSQAQLRNLARSIQKEKEKESVRIARNIHDDLGQVLSLIKFDISWIESMLKHDRDEIKQKIEDSKKKVEHAIKTVQNITTDLRPTMLDTLGLEDALSWQCENFENGTKIKCSIKFMPKDIKIDKDLSVELFRIFQEALTNALRHAKAKKIISYFKIKNSFITFSIEDDGIGIDENKINDPNSCGLFGMRERVFPWEGTVKISGKKNAGTKILIEIPYKA